jgi:hypothetical protein
MHLSLKPGVKLFGIRPELAAALPIIASCYADFNNAECVITSITDGNHGSHSHHYKGYACDVRTRNVPEGMHARLRDAIQRALGTEFQVILESTHIHVEYDPE